MEWSDKEAEAWKDYQPEPMEWSDKEAEAWKDYQPEPMEWSEVLQDIATKEPSAACWI